MLRFFAPKPSRRPKVYGYRPRLCVERLEDRCLLSTTATQVGGLLEITSSDNQVTITELATKGSYSVNAPTLNGNNPVDFNGVTDISFVGSFNQTVSLVGLAGDLPSTDTTSLSGNLAINTNAALTVDVNQGFNVTGNFTIQHSGTSSLNLNVIGNDVTLGPTTVTDVSPADSQIVFNNGAVFTSFVSLNLGVGNNNVTIGGATGVSPVDIGSFLSVSSGPGNDSVTVTGSTIGQNFGVTLFTGVNTVAVSNSTISGNLITSDSGTENFTLNNGSVVQGFVSLNYGSSNPSTTTIGGGADPNTVIAGFLSVGSGAGADVLTLTDTSVGQNFAFALGLGANSVTITGSTFSANLEGFDSGTETFSLTTSSVAGFVSINYQPSPSITITIGGATNPPLVIGGFLSIAGGGGANTVNVTNTAVYGNIAVLLPGADSVTFTDVAAVQNLSMTCVAVDTVSLTLQGNAVTGATQLTLGNGADTVSVNDSVFQGSFGITAGNGADSINLEATAKAGDDSDTFNTVFYAPVLVSTGTGKCTVTVGTSPTATDPTTDLAVFYSTATFDGAAASTFTNTAAEFLGGPPTLINY
jgi:hypothetical protein